MTAPPADMLDAFLDALMLRGGYNAGLVAVGAALLGAAAGGTGAFVFLRKRALISDAASHAALPGVALAFMAMVAAGGDGRWLPGLMAGAAASAALGLLAVDAMTRATRLSEDAAIGAVLSSFFGLGVVLLTVVQGMGAGRQAGLDGFLLGSTAGMLFDEALTVAVAGGLAALALIALRRPLTLAAFDPGFAEATGVDLRRADLALLALALAVTVIGLKIAGIVLIVALLIIPPTAARFWTERVDALVGLSALFGAVSGYVGAALSAAAERLPTGPVVTLAAFALFAASFLLAPARGLAAAAWRRRGLQRRAHRRQGLLALARGEAIYDRDTVAELRRAGFVAADLTPTLAGRAAAAGALRDEARWALVRRDGADEALTARDDGLTPLDALLTPDQLAHLDRRLGGPRPAGA
jgi:manganese/zinc/iron transport system permease protein